MSRQKRNTGPTAVTDLVVGHANPDFDAYASMVGATKLYPGTKAVFLGSQNANVREFHNLHEDFLDFVDLKVLDLGAVSRVIMVDTRDATRIGELGPVVTRPDVEVIVYDHHPPAEGDLTPAEDHSMLVGATTSIVVHEIQDQGMPLTPLEASVLLLGIHEDTGSLTYVNTTAYDAEAVAFLMESGADLEVVNEFLARALNEQQRQLLEQLVDSLQVWDVRGQRVAVGTARASEYIDSASVLTHHICEELGHRVAVAIIEMPGRIHVVGRSRLVEVDIGAVLGRLGGGGHAQAASAALKDASMGDVVSRLREALALEVPPPLTVGDIMSRPVRMATPSMSMAEAGRLMATWGHGGLPVLDEGRLVGLVTRKDVDKAVRHGLDHAPVTGFMAREPITVDPDTPVEDLRRLLATAGIGRVPVVSGSSVVGIVTRKDLLRAEYGAAYLDRTVSRKKGEASERFMASFERLLPEEVRAAVRTIGRLAAEEGLRAHVVGGFVRDMLLGRPNLDVDVVIEGDGLAFSQRVAELLGWHVKVHRRFGTAVLVVNRTLHVDVTSARTEYYTRPGALPTVERSSLRQDLFRRDFSINAMAASIAPDSFGAIVDPFGGLGDLERGVIRSLHSLSFVEDPTRVLRAARFETKYAFKIDGPTEALLRQAVDMQMLEEVSGARLREELLDIIDEEHVAPVLSRLEDFGALHTLLPEGIDCDVVIDEVARTTAAYDRLASEFEHPVRRRVTLVVPLAASAGRSGAEKWLRRMRFGKEYAIPTLAAAERRVALGRMLEDGRRMRDSRLFFALDALPPETVIYLWGVSRELGRQRIEKFVTELRKVRLEVSGHDLVALGLEPGPEFSGILAQTLADRLDGRAVGREAELADLKRLARRGAQRER
ncbi:MAG: CBS domain-containing protein [Actinomycetia bacterium]|nr:CBS domain-containing protein [Actinomycetes bacterium]